MPETIGIRDAKAQLSRLARRVQQGDTVTLTHRGRPVARIVPYDEAEVSPEARIQELVRRGWLEEQNGPPVVLPRLEVDRDLAQTYLREDRDAE